MNLFYARDWHLGWRGAAGALHWFRLRVIGKGVIANYVQCGQYSKTAESFIQKCIF